MSQLFHKVGRDPVLNGDLSKISKGVQYCGAVGIYVGKVKPKTIDVKRRVL